MGGVADISYTKLLELISTCQPSHSKEMTNFISCVCARQGNFLWKLGKCKEHKMFVEAICVLIQYNMENGYPIMEII